MTVCLVQIKLKILQIRKLNKNQIKKILLILLQHHNKNEKHHR